MGTTSSVWSYGVPRHAGERADREDGLLRERDDGIHGRHEAPWVGSNKQPSPARDPSRAITFAITVEVTHVAIAPDGGEIRTVEED